MCRVEAGVCSVLSSGAGARARPTSGWSCWGSDLLLLHHNGRILCPAHSTPWVASHTCPLCIFRPCICPLCTDPPGIGHPCTCPRSSAPSPFPGGRGDGHSISHHGGEEARGNHDLYRNPCHSDREEVSCHNTCLCHHICHAPSLCDGHGNDLDDLLASRRPRARLGPV